MKVQPWIYFRVSLDNHRYYDAHTGSHIERLLWAQWAFSDEGAHFVESYDRYQDNRGSKIFDQLVLNEAAKWRARVASTSKYYQ